MADESIDSGLSSEKSQASKDHHHQQQRPLQVHSSADQSKTNITSTGHSYPPQSRTPTGDRCLFEEGDKAVTETNVDLYTAHELTDCYSRMSGSNGSSRTGFNPPPNRQRFTGPSSHFQQNQQHQQTPQPTPRVHFVRGNQEEAAFQRNQPLAAALRSRNFSDGVMAGNYRPRAPFSRSLSSKMFEYTENPQPNSSGRRFRAPSPPINRWRSSGESWENKSQLFHSLPGGIPRCLQPDVLDKGVQCERDVSIQGSTKPRGITSQQVQQPTNPLLSALLAAANATANCPEQQQQQNSLPNVRRSLRGRPQGSLPYWSDSEVNAYDTLEAFSSPNQGGGKQYPTANAVAAAAAAAALALAGLQSSSGRLGSLRVNPISAAVAIPASTGEEIPGGIGQDMNSMFRNLTTQLAESSLYSRFSTLPTQDNVIPLDLGDHRKSCNYDLLLGSKQDAYSKSQLSCRPVEKNQQTQVGSPQFVNPDGQISNTRFSFHEETPMTIQMPGPQDTGQLEQQMTNPQPSSSTSSFKMGAPLDNSSLITGQFNFLSSEPYPLSLENARVPQSPHTSGNLESSRCTQLNVDRRPEETDGLLVVNVIAGSGLKTSQMLLRDLYCVLEADSVRKARSMIRTNTDFFEWDEVFEIEVEDNQFLSLLVYQWDPRTRHRLCFYGGVDLVSLIRRLQGTSTSIVTDADFSNDADSKPLTSPVVSRASIRFEKIALQLEPKGILYLQIAFLPIQHLFLRRNLSNSYENALFGVSLDELAYRNRFVPPGILSNDSSVIPFLIRKCVEEVDRRGTEVVGIYRLSGSVWMKLQVRELFARTAEKIVQGIAKRNEKAIKIALATLDLSADSVPDIHAITATLKDFFRELPEPLFTNALYPMVYEATQVAGPGDSHMGTKLILNILDCLPTSNQELLLYLLDHLKRITSKSVVNKMTTRNLAVCLAPVLLYPSPDVARDMEPSLIEPQKMVSILECILDIWP